jgi:biopolymer transport protein ExbD
VRISAKRKETPHVDLTPLIDVVFLLLIFFMVSTTFERESELAIELPEASARSDPTPEKHLDVSVDAKGRYYLDGRPLVNTQAATLLQALRQRAQELGGNPPVVVSADQASPYQAVMAVLDAAQRAGLARVRFATRIAAPQGAEN